MRWVISSEILAVHAPVHQQVPVARVVNPLCTPHPQGRWVCAVFFFSVAPVTRLVLVCGSLS